MTHTVRSIDALINNIPEAQPINYAKPPTASEGAKNDASEAISKRERPENPPERSQNDPKNDPVEPKVEENAAKSPQKEPKNAENTPTSSENQQSAAESTEQKATSGTEVDEYGNAIPPPKTYTEEQVQAMIRDRLKRGAFKQEQQPSPQQVQQAEQSGFQYNENSELSWSQQLKVFVKETMQEVKNEEHSAQRQAVQKQAQAEFESKFHAGMAKYPDFIETMSDKVVTDDMVMAVRGLENPAAFLYTAAKRMPAELDRISKIRDPYQQVAEMGRLHEKLAKTKPTSNAPRPLSPDRSDVTEKIAPKYSIDHLIAEDAKKRYGH